METKQKICGIYSLMSPSGKRYIGKSVNIKNRFDKYKTLNCKGQPKLYNALVKYNYDSFLIQILIECDKQELNEYEKLYILTYDTVNNGYNCSAGGDGGLSAVGGVGGSGGTGFVLIQYIASGTTTTTLLNNPGVTTNTTIPAQCTSVKIWAMGGGGGGGTTSTSSYCSSGGGAGGLVFYQWLPL